MDGNGEAWPHRCRVQRWASSYRKRARTWTKRGVCNEIGNALQIQRHRCICEKHTALVPVDRSVMVGCGLWVLQTSCARRARHGRASQLQSKMSRLSRRAQRYMQASRTQYDYVADAALSSHRGRDAGSHTASRNSKKRCGTSLV